MKPAQLITIVLLPALLLLGLVSGCGPTEKVTSLPRLDAPGLERLIKQHEGQFVLVDFWATWCPPCVRLFPYVAQLQQRLGAKGLVVITVSLDDPAEEAMVQRFLANKDAATKNYISSYGVGPQAMSEFAIPRGAIPHLRLYDRQGKLAASFPSAQHGLDPQEIVQVVEGIILGTANVQ